MTLMMTSRGTPILYYGDELAMPGGEDPDNRRDFPGGFPGDLRNAFEDAGREPNERTVWNHIAKLGALRKTYPALTTGKSLDLVDAEQQYAYARISDEHTLLIALNNDTQPATIELDPSVLPSKSLAKGWSFQCDDLLGSINTLRVENDSKNPSARVTLPARSSAVFLLPQ
jgi:glycosidase